jgi:hypothetical protein
MGGYMGAKFFVDGDTYPKFRCKVGLPSRHTEGQDEYTDTVFFVETDEKENLVYSEEIEYKAKRLMEVRLKPGEPIQEIDVNIHGAHSLIIGTKSSFHKDPETGKIEWSIPHVAVCEPILSKN